VQIIIFAALALVSAQPPSAAPAPASPTSIAGFDEDARCIIEATSAPDRSEIATIAVRPELRESSTAYPRLIQRGAECGRRNGWSPSRSSQVGTYAVATILRDEYRVQLRAAGIDVAIVDAWFESLSDELRLNVFEESNAAAIGEQVRALEARNVIPTARLAAAGHMIGGYIAALSMVERARRGVPLVN